MFFAIWVLTEVLIDSIPIEISVFFKIRKNNQEKFLELFRDFSSKKRFLVISLILELEKSDFSFIASFF